MLEAGPSDEPEQNPPIRLPSRSFELLELLRDGEKGAAADLYEGALRVLADRLNPARVPMAAYALREVIVELGNAAGLASRGPSLTERVRQLERPWLRVRSAGDSSEVSESELTTALDTFFDGFNTDYKVGLERAAAIIRGHDPAGREGPPEVRDSRASALVGFRDGFNRALHGSDRATEFDRFRAMLDTFEGFLLSWLRPRTFAELDAIDDLLHKGPPGE